MVDSIQSSLATHFVPSANGQPATTGTSFQVDAAPTETVNAVETTSGTPDISLEDNPRGGFVNLQA